MQQNPLSGDYLYMLKRVFSIFALVLGSLGLIGFTDVAGLVARHLGINP